MNAPRASPFVSRLAAALLASALLGGARLPAQQREVPTPSEFLTSHDDSLFSLPRSQEDIHQWEQALEELRQGRIDSAVERLHRLLGSETGGVAPVAADRFVGLWLAVVLTLANLSPGAAEAYERLVEREAGRLVDLPATDLSEDQLLSLADRYPASRVGNRARRRLADMMLERGDALGATSHFRKLLDGSPIGTPAERSAMQGLFAAGVLAAPRDHRADRDAGAADLLSVVPEARDLSEWPMPGGRYGSDGTMDEPAGRPESRFTLEVPAHGSGFRGGAYSMFPVGDMEGIFVDDGFEVLAIDPLRAEIAWKSQTPLREMGDPAFLEREYEASYNENMVLAPAVGGDVVVAALQVPENSENVDFRAGFRILSKIPERRLYAFERRTGRQIWSHFDRLDGPVARRFEGHSACGPPIVVGDTVFAPTHDRSNAIAFYVSAYDLHTGAVKWRRLVCSSQQDVNMFGNARTEFAASPLLARDGVIYGSTNLGICFALDMPDGRVRWLTAYEVIPLPMAQLHRQQDRPVYFANNPPSFQDGVVAVMPLDSRYVLGLDAESGRTLWRLPYEARTNGNNDVRWLLGAAGGRFVLAGAGVVSLPPRPKVNDMGIAIARSVQRPEYLGDSRFGVGEAPRPALTREHVFFPTAEKLSVFDLEGTIAEQSGMLRPKAPGNLLLVDGMVVVLRDRHLEILFDRAALRSRAEARLQRAPTDPAAILRLARLREALLDATSGEQDRAAVERLYRAGLEAASDLPPSDPVRKALATKLFSIAFQRAMAARAAGAADARDLLRAAREQAPDFASWMEVEVELVDGLRGSREDALAEIEIARARGRSRSFALGGNPSLPVEAWALWQRAELLEGSHAVEAWQELLESFPDQRIGGKRAEDAAKAAIAEAIERHGERVYAAIEARAAEAFERAGDGEAELRGLCRRFPNSRAASSAQRRLLDKAVDRGDLGAVLTLMAGGASNRVREPGLLRRAAAAAAKAGNAALAREYADRLVASHADEPSDWPPDQGRTYAESVRDLPRPAKPRPIPLQVPRMVLSMIDEPGYRLMPCEPAKGFAPPNDVPLYAISQDAASRNQSMTAFDLSSPRTSPRALFRFQVRLPDPLILCGRVLLVADLMTVTGIDYRTGEVLWQLPNPDSDVYASLGVQGGILHVSATSGQPGGEQRFLGIEPKSGVVVFDVRMPRDQSRTTPKGTGEELLWFDLSGTLPVLERVDPTTGSPRARIPLDANVQRAMGITPDGLRRARMFPASLCADEDRVFLPIDSPMSDGPSRLCALGNDGRLSWVWTGARGRRLLMVARRGPHLCAVESDAASGRALVLRASDGGVLREAELEEAAQVLNWQRSWQPSPAPAALLVGDRGEDGSPRILCFGIDEGIGAFAQALTPQDEGFAPTPYVAEKHICYAVRPAGRQASLRLYAISIPDRRGVMPAGRKFLGLPGSGPYMLGTAGPYTVLATAERILILGDERNR
ncbi:MAG: hypothetical protein Fur0037_07700 [Planctomycetota bacterium]